MNLRQMMYSPLRHPAYVAVALLLAFFVAPVRAADDELVPIPLTRGKPPSVGTPKSIPPGVNIRKPTGHPRPAFLAPKGTINLARNKPVSSSAPKPVLGQLDQITDGDKAATDGSYVELARGRQWVQIDLQATANIYAIVVWHNFMDPRIYRDVIVQLSDDPNFQQNVNTIFNNDNDNSSGLGAGKDFEEFEDPEGHLIDAHGQAARYVRLYSNGSTADDLNHYTEVEVFGIPRAK
jgi:hypothetical protein